MKHSSPTLSDAVQRTREDIEFQMADENLKLKAMSLQLRNFDSESNTKHESLEQRFKQSIDELANQKQRLMEQVKQVKIFISSNLLTANRRFEFTNELQL